jgi:Xaa-Pro aminopeptidase
LIKKIKKINHKNKTKKIFLMKDRDTGQSTSRKVNKLKILLKKNKIDLQLISASENIAWLLNIRGYDSQFSPLPNGYLIINEKNKIIFFCDLKKINKTIKKKFKNIKIIDIKNIELFLSKIENKKIQIDIASCSILFRNLLKKNNKIIEVYDPVYLMKSIKNKIEIQNIVKSHVYDGSALTKFIF